MSGSQLAAQPTEQSSFAVSMVLVASMAGVLMQSLDTTITNIALPYMQGSISASREQISWVLTSYIIAAGIMTAPVGWTAARFGKKNFLLASLLAFTLISMLCGAAQSLEQLVFLRFLQGACGAALPPLSQAILLYLYPVEKRGRVMAIWSMGAMLGPVLGPTVGGFLTDAYSWRWVFYVNVPFGILASICIAFFFKDNSSNANLRFDRFGFATLSVALGALFLLLSRGSELDWFESQEIRIEALISGAAFYLFFVHMATAKDRLFPARIFRDRNFCSALLLAFFINVLLLGTVSLLPPYLQGLGGYPVYDAGYLMAPRGVAMMVSMIFAGRFLGRVDYRWTMTVAIALVIWSMWEMTAWAPQIDTMTLTFVTAVQGFGLGLIFVPLNLVAFLTMAPALRTDAAALANLVGRLGGTFGVLVTTLVFVNSVQSAHARLSSYATPFNRMFLIDGASSLANFNQLIDLRAQNIAYANSFMLMFYISLSAIAFIWLMKKQ